MRLLTPRYWPTWAGLGLLRLLALLPFVCIVPLGRALGRLLRHLPLGFINTARRNIELCLPELSREQREHLLKEHFASLGIALLEIPMAWWLGSAKLAKVTSREAPIPSKLDPVSSAASTCWAIFKTCRAGHGGGSTCSRSLSVPPRTSSMTRYSRPSSSPESYTGKMFGCSRCAMVSTSRWKRWTKSA